VIYYLNIYDDMLSAALPLAYSTPTEALPVGGQGENKIC
jgi:hypothetical protein